MGKDGIHHAVKCLLIMILFDIFNETCEPKEIGKSSRPVDAVFGDLIYFISNKLYNGLMGAKSQRTPQE